MSDRRRVELPPDRYDDRWRALEATGHDVHGEANLIETLVQSPARVLDAGCGTGRVAIELTRRGFVTVGIDVDRSLLDAARAKAPDLVWIDADLASMADGVAAGPFDAIVMAGNVMIFVAPGTERPRSWRTWPRASRPADSWWPAFSSTPPASVPRPTTSTRPRPDWTQSRTGRRGTARPAPPVTPTSSPCTSGLAPSYRSGSRSDSPSPAR